MKKISTLCRSLGQTPHARILVANLAQSAALSQTEEGLKNVANKRKETIILWKILTQTEEGLKNAEKNHRFSEYNEYHSSPHVNTN